MARRPPVRQTPHVALIVETSSHYGREILVGVTRYLRTHRPWSVFLEQHLDSAVPAWFGRWAGNGVISRAADPGVLLPLVARGVPVVDVSDRRPAVADLPRVNSDDDAIGRMAADHLWERGYRHFAFCGFAGERWSDCRRAGFVGRLADRGRDGPTSDTPWVGRMWEREQDSLARWLAALPRPLGVFAANDFRGQQVLDASRRAGLRVPGDVAVVGVDDEPVVCELCDPPLSSIRPDAARVGFLAAELLDAMMGTEPRAVTSQRVPPVGVSARQSSDALAVDDPETAAAVAYIRANACRGATVADVLRHTGLSRSDLERRFRRHLGRSPHEELGRVRLDRAKELLAGTDLKVGVIADRVGFAHAEYLCVFFKRAEGETPGEYRRRTRPVRNSAT